MAIKLAVTKIDEERRDSVRALFRKLIETDDLEAAFVVVRKSDGCWTWHYDGNSFTTEMVGRIEIAKQELVRDYINGSMG